MLLKHFLESEIWDVLTYYLYLFLIYTKISGNERLSSADLAGLSLPHQPVNWANSQSVFPLFLQDGHLSEPATCFRFFFFLFFICCRWLIKQI